MCFVGICVALHRAIIDDKRGELIYREQYLP